MTSASCLAMSAGIKKYKNRKDRKAQVGPTQALADPHRLYEISVQNTEITIDFINLAFETEHDKLPLSLREDFCGTAKLCADWVSSDPQRIAVGLDNNASTIAWALRNNVAPLGENADRVEIIKRNVLKGTRRRFDVIAAFNFSYWIFRERDVLKSYLKSVYNGLVPGGVFLADLYGGPDAQYTMEETTKHDGFTYVWDQDTFDPITHHTECHIHFRFPDGSELNKAFSYNWRAWTLPELKDILQEVGFERVDTWWDGEDNILRPTESTQNLVSWVSYLAAWRQG
ncbi:MAG: class I SAM-dependent methyltransferase [Proteobacteria bacterium]|nr:class I SAM-dependent methyltransferase [Pseudomonadota bacterium]